MSSTNAHHGAGDGRRPKMTLFCPTCGHEGSAGADGDWHLVERDGRGERRIAYECPVCGGVVAAHRVLPWSR
ncbi:hypothetical protein [Halomarina ordinaria]|uniref:DUF8106 domain-containing protein n=1 Tax=Halomarina ordinaria TaxID=3033939 RepID=A0ABD5U840_9EURY|nr:hypothetical protein [Halomarina sp. PSRA2]